MVCRVSVLFLKRVLRKEIQLKNKVDRSRSRHREVVGIWEVVVKMSFVTRFSAITFFFSFCFGHSLSVCFRLEKKAT